MTPQRLLLVALGLTACVSFVTFRIPHGELWFWLYLVSLAIGAQAFRSRFEHGSQIAKGLKHSLASPLTALWVAEHKIRPKDEESAELLREARERIQAEIEAL